MYVKVINRESTNMWNYKRNHSQHQQSKEDEQSGDDDQDEQDQQVEGIMKASIMGESNQNMWQDLNGDNNGIMMKGCFRRTS